jgi:phytoene dehydrogenase-like protein
MTDAIVIGAGPNGLVAANLLTDAGWDVLVLEAADEPGGAVRSSAEVADGFVHDTFSSFYPLAAASPTVRRLELERFGLRWSHAPAAVGNPMPDGGWAIVHPDPADTAAALEARHDGDGDAWLELYRRWTSVSEDLVGALLSPFPPVRHGARLAPRLARPGGPALLQLMLSSVRWLGRRHFGGTAAPLLLATNAQHADIGPDSAGSGLMGWLLVMLAQQVGYPVPVGGAGELTAALCRRLEAGGGRLVCGAEVTEVLVEARRATGVRTRDGGRFAARRAILADVPAPALYGGLVGWQELPARTRTAIDGFEWDPATLKVDWALDRPVPWADPPPLAPGTVHVADSVDELARTATQLAAGELPADPFLVLGQMTTADSSRSPAGTESAWAYTHLPHGVPLRNGERLADRMQARIERLAPGFESSIVARRVLTPAELERRNRNLVDGALNGGTAALHQQLVLRPIPGLGRAETPIRRLYLASASAHPGGGVHGACGANAARAALWHARFQRR